MVYDIDKHNARLEVYQTNNRIKIEKNLTFWNFECFVEFTKFGLVLVNVVYWFKNVWI